MYHVMIVDDEPVSQDYIRGLIPWEAEGFQVYPPVYAVPAARELLQSAPVEIVLLDVSMPGENGVVLSRYIAAHYPRVAVLAISSHDDYDYVREILKNGAHDYMLKHRLNRETLLFALKGVVEKINGSAETREEDIKERMRRLLASNPPPKAPPGARGMRINLSLARKKILRSILEERNMAGAAVLIREIFAPPEMADQGIRLSVAKDLYEILSPAIKERGLSFSLDGYALLEWVRGKTARECAARFNEIFREIMGGEERPFSDYIRRADALILESFAAADLGLEDAARELKISPSYLSRLYKKETGIAFVDGINRVRVSAAKVCLLDGMNLKETASHCGFRHYNYFIKVFKDYAGRTPAEFTHRMDNDKIL